MATSTFAQLREIIPYRALTPHEATGLAEAQAAKLLYFAGVTEPAVPETIITELPRLQIERVPMPFSGSSSWQGGRWVIEINANEAYVRNRWTLAHELKHILDHPLVDRLYPPFANQTRAQRAERAADYFAASLLIPRVLLKRYFGQGVQNIDDLAELFADSAQAMSYRLQQVGLTPITPRHRSYTRPSSKVA